MLVAWSAIRSRFRAINNRLIACGMRFGSRMKLISSWKDALRRASTASSDNNTLRAAAAILETKASYGFRTMFCTSAENVRSIDHVRNNRFVRLPTGTPSLETPYGRLRAKDG